MDRGSTYAISRPVMSQYFSCGSREGKTSIEPQGEHKGSEVDVDERLLMLFHFRFDPIKEFHCGFLKGLVL